MHLDGDWRVAWSHFIRADVFVMSPSAFSALPSYLNEKCVLWTSSVWTTLRFPHWISTSDLEGRNGRCALETCLLGGSNQTTQMKSCLAVRISPTTYKNATKSISQRASGSHPHSKGGMTKNGLLVASKHKHKPG